MLRRGRPRLTVAQRNAARRQRNARRQRLQEIAQHLRDAATRIAAQGPRRSLRIEWLQDNAASIAAGYGPGYTFILFGEENYPTDDPPPDGYSIVVDYD